MAILISGGAGYIGSVVAELLHNKARNFVVLDNLSRGNSGSIIKNTPFYIGNIANKDLVEKIIDKHNITQCIHFAAYAYVGESVTNPQIYYENNVTGSLHFINTLLQKNVKQIVFSSSCAVYGIPKSVPVTENQPFAPINPYGWSKLIIEKVLESYASAYNLNYIALRYFNVAGATQSKGEYHSPETHIIPNILATANKEKSILSINGNDHPTHDGTTVRDYVHVYDLATAHINAIDYLQQEKKSNAINLGNGKGHSILELIDACRKVTQKDIPIEFAARQQGDPPILIANNNKAKTVLGWTPQYSCISEIIKSAWQWKIKHPNGYPCIS
ncbi:UDP-glucose 4-epimerase GalE [Candidatus Uabimicrobium sp. HlEnr_7]|uniref:UDP-glucose 4-epimerase GalE n=1 Tax=Candidatus Uabimicrobium helgolandensis TaxID=3095367 RepID=UPI003557A306